MDCIGNHEDNGLNLVSGVYRLRIAPTNQTFDKLHKGKLGKNNLWSHSEGSLIVQLMFNSAVESYNSTTGRDTATSSVGH
jgi:hypothetical protein